MTPKAGGTTFERREPDWLEVHEARARVLASAHPLRTERVGLSDAWGRALGEEVLATATLPPWDNSAMDGYAVRSEDVSGASRLSPVQLSVVGVVRAGGGMGPRVGPGEAVRIMTGAPIPPGSDTVIRVEDTDAEAQAGQVRIFQERDRGRHVRSAGQDMRAGESLLTPGHPVTSGAVGVLAAAGLDTVLVHQVPTVAILATGDELKSSSQYEDVRAGQGIPESNVPMLSAMVRRAGALPIDLGIAADNPEDILRRVEAGAAADVLVTIGGASMGEADLMKRVLDEVGFDQTFWRVKMRPGSPISFGSIPHGPNRQPVFGLPGNPSSAFVTFEVFVRPFLLKLSGHRRLARRTIRCSAAEPFGTPSALTYFQRVSLSMGTDGMRASLTGSQGSGLVTGLARADGLAIIPPEIDATTEGDPVDVMLLDTGPAALEIDVG
jgi:molybdopterin molybdotransferase